MEEYVRPPAVAGQFYAGSAEALRREIEDCYRHELGPGALPEINEAGARQIVGLVSPHAGYIYSGPPAACGFCELARDGRPELVIILGPSHRPGRSSAVLQTEGAWATPLGQTSIDADIAAILLESCPNLTAATRELEYEHSLEVQLPFLQHLYGEALSIVLIMMFDQSWEIAESLAAAIAQACQQRDVVIIASTDMTHQQPTLVAREQDLMLVRYMEKLDPRGLLAERARRGITMCGYGPTATMLAAARQLGAHRGELITYTNSGDVQPMPTVVGYVSLKVVR